MIKSLSIAGIIISSLLILLLIITALFAGILTGYDPILQNLQDRFSPPSSQHLFGADSFGRDVLTRVLYGFRSSLGVGALSILIALIIGALLGIAAGSTGSVIYSVIITAARFLSAGPGIILTILMAVWSRSPLGCAIGIAIILIPGFIRVFSSIISYKKAGDILLVIIAQMALSMALAVLLYAGLSYIGLGAQPPTAEPGLMIAHGIRYLRNGPHEAVIPGIALVLTALSFNILGESLNTYVLTKEKDEPSPAGSAPID